ncbi:cell division cycle 123 homolog [Olea europaea subsp. europaea]|uniref:Cell division cycle 123 homolog n=1 Tax=Olea europaea subsp. europaea TaxID=158383 RepID=A0A8S0REQ3_OLEEU|nr:cell division cycle 123 homolog [Olea europaea subsp. europaea]
MKEEEINGCQIQEWYPKYKSLTIKTRIYELSESFIQYLLLGFGGLSVLTEWYRRGSGGGGGAGGEGGDGVLMFLKRRLLVPFLNKELRIGGEGGAGKKMGGGVG